VQLLTRHGVGLIVLTNFGNANTYQLGRRVIAAVYNHWDDATCQRAKLHFYMEMDGPKIKQINARKLDGEICPVK
jgi:hypothetical protein